MFNPLKSELDKFQASTHLGLVSANILDFINDGLIRTFQDQPCSAEVSGRASILDLTEVVVDLQNLVVSFTPKLGNLTIPEDAPIPGEFAVNNFLEIMDYKDSPIYFKLIDDHVPCNEYKPRNESLANLFTYIENLEVSGWATPLESTVICSLRIDRRKRTLYILIIGSIHGNVPPIMLISPSAKRSSRINMYNDAKNTILCTYNNKD